MSVETLAQYLIPVDIEIENIFLDPNNPRFVTSNWSAVPIQEIDDADVQETTRRSLIRRFDVAKLRMNMEVNGFLPIDRVIVKEFKEGKYVVLEGNRRICAAKLISQLTVEGGNVSEEVLRSVNRISCLQYTGEDPNAAWVFQGLRHIVGITEWSAFNKAKLLVEQMEAEDLNQTEVGKRFGLSAHGAGQWIRAYHAFIQAKEESDYLAEVDERSFTFFQELFGRSSIAVRDWLDWDDTSHEFKSGINFNEFVGWLYPRPSNADGSPEEVQGDWDTRRLARRDDLRTLAWLMREEPDLFQQFRSGSDLEGVYALALSRKQQEQAKAKSDPVAEVYDSVDNCTKALDNLPLKMIREENLKNQLFEKLTALEERISFVKS